MTVYYFFIDEPWGSAMPFSYFFFDTYIGYLLQIVPVALLAALACFLARRYLLRRRTGRPREFAVALFAGYAAALWALVLTPHNFLVDIWYWLFHHQGGPSLSGLPLFDIGRWNYSLHFGGFLRGEAIGNLLLFLPLGAFLRLLWPRLRWRAIPLALGVSAAVEVLQMPLGRSFDGRDLIANTLGAAAGLALGLLLQKLFPRTARAIGQPTEKKRETD